jgi:hypothetical protein
MKYTHVQAYDATMRARMRSTGPVCIPAAPAPVRALPARQSASVRPRSLSFQAWLELRGLADAFRAADKQERAELCRRFGLEVRGRVYMTEAERRLPCVTVQATAIN